MAAAASKTPPSESSQSAESAAGVAPVAPARKLTAVGASDAGVAGEHVVYDAGLAPTSVDRDESNSPTGRIVLDSTDRNNRRRTGRLLKSMCAVAPGGLAAISRATSISEDVLGQIIDEEDRNGHGKFGRIHFDKMLRSPPSTLHLVIAFFNEQLDAIPPPPTVPPSERILQIVAELGEIAATNREALRDHHYNRREKATLTRLASRAEATLARLRKDIEAAS